jgi:hypothetical protein
MSRYHTCRIKRGAMVQTASTSEADQSHVPGATAIRVSGILLILLGGYRLYVMTSAVVELAQEGVYAELWGAYVGLFLSGVLGLLTLVAGIRLVRLAGRIFGLVVCSVVLALEVISYGSKVVVFKLITSSPTQSLGLRFWLLQPFNIVVFLVVIILALAPAS